jgi:hypothetical protein
MDALAKLQELYDLKKNTDEQIAKVEALLGADPKEAIARRKRAPQTCSNCGAEGHTARTCSATPADKAA